MLILSLKKVRLVIMNHRTERVCHENDIINLILSFTQNVDTEAIADQFPKQLV